MTARSPRPQGYARLVLVLVATLALAPAGAGTSGSTSKKPYVFGVFPFLSADQLQEAFSPLAADLAHQLGRPVLLQTRPEFNAFADALKRQRYDIALVQPFDYLWAHDRYGYVAVAARSERLAAEFMVRSDSALRTFADLRGKTIGMPPKGSAMSYLAQDALHKRGMRPGKNLTVRYFRAHDVCLHQLLIGTIDSCVSAVYPVAFFEKTWGVKFRTLAQTHGIPHAVFIVNRRTAAPERARIARIILSWGNTQTGRSLLKAAHSKPFVPAKDSDYDVLRAMVRRVTLQ